MLRRCWVFAVVAIFGFSFAPVWGQNPTSTYKKEAVQALSKKIDEHLAKTWKKAKVTPAPKAEDTVFFRRLHLDLVGHTPYFIDVDDFLSNDASDKRWSLVDRLIDSDEHSRHFANVWRNIMLGYQTNQQFQFLLPQFEFWIRSRVKNNLTLDKMVNQLLTSNQGGNMGRPGVDYQSQGNPQLFFLANENKAENLAAATSRVFLGVKIECAQCHAHPFAKWKQDQFWEFAAFFSTPPQIIRKGIQPVEQPKQYQAGREIRIPGSDKLVKAKFISGQEPNWEANSNSRQVVANWVTSAENPYFAKAMADHIWSYMMGVSILEPIMEPSDDIPMTHPELLNDLARALIENNFDAKFLIRAIVHTDAYQRSSGGAKLADKEDYHLFVRMPIRALSPEQLFDSVEMVISTTGKLPELAPNPQQGFNPQLLQTPRAQFLNKFQTQDRRHEPQTSILQALFMMNSGLMAEKTKLANNDNLKTLANVKADGGNRQRLRSIYRIVLSRDPRESDYDRLVPYLDKGGATNNLGDALSDVYWALLNSSEFMHNH